MATHVWREYVEEIRDGVDFPLLVEGIVGPLGHHPTNGRAVVVHCPWHDDRHTKSLAVYGDHAYCFGLCNRSFDAFDWVMQRDGVDFCTARDNLARQHGILKPCWTAEQEEAAREQHEYEEALSRAAHHLGDRLLQTSRGLEYARSRAWSDEVIREESLGYADGSPLPHLGHERAQRVVEELNQWAGRVGGAIIYAHRESGRVHYLTGRAIGQKQHHNPPADLAGPRHPYRNALYSPRAAELVIVEGQADAVTLAGWGMAALALAGNRLSDDLAARLNRQVERGTVLYVIPDGDGRTDLERLAEAVGPLLYVVTLPDEIHDTNDYGQRGATAEDLRGLLDSAATYLDHRIEEATQAQGAARDRAIESLFPFLAQLPPVTLARYKGRVTGALEEIGARDFNHLLRAARGSEAEQSAPAELLEGRYPVVTPALDFLDDLAVVTVPLLSLSDGRPIYLPYLVTSERQILPVAGERLITIGEREVVLRDPPTAMGRATRWEYDDVRAYLDGDAPDPVRVYLETERLLDKYVDFRDQGTSDVLAVWTMGTYLYPLFEAFPYLGFQGPKNSGKTKTQGLIGQLAFNARTSSNMSSASLFRVVQATRGTLGIDEAERLSNPRDPANADLRLLLNAGYKKGSPAIRCEGEDHRVVEFEVYGPKTIASIRGVEEVLGSRCIHVTMLRTAGPKGNLVLSGSGENWAQARHGLYCFALQHFARVRARYLRGAGAAGLSNRQAELWRPLLAIASCLDDQGAEGLLALVRDYARRKAQQARISGLDEWRTALLLALHQLTSGGDTEITPQQVRRALVDFMDADDHERVTAQWVGYRLREFGFERLSKGSSRGSVYAIDADGVLDVMTRYELQVEQVMEGSSDDDENGIPQ